MRRFAVWKSGAALFADVVQARGMRDQSAGNDVLRGARERMRAVVVEQHDLVVVGAYRVLREIRSEQR
jgi:hypothetical protein